MPTPEHYVAQHGIVRDQCRRRDMTQTLVDKMTKNTLPVIKLIVMSMTAMVLASCSKEETQMSSDSELDFRQFTLDFTKTLAAREYAKAYAMTSRQYRMQNTAERLRSDFEAIVPDDWGTMGPIEVAHTMTSWPGQQPSDTGWAYISIGGDMYSEAVTVVVTSEDGETRVRAIEFGRP